MYYGDYEEGEFFAEDVDFKDEKNNRQGDQAQDQDNNRESRDSTEDTSQIIQQSDTRNKPANSSFA